jgi:hypothetical protein
LRLTEEKGAGMEMNMEKSKVMRMSRQPSAIQIMRDQKQLENIGYLNQWDGMITTNERRTREIKSRIVKTKAAFKDKGLLTKGLLTNKRG